jgi:hypothetical protein
MAGVQRACIFCTLEDDHPKHEQIHPGMVSVYAHIDCCARVTHCPLCTKSVQGAEGKRGDDLRAHITSGKG